MTQKEHREQIEIYEKQIKNLKEELAMLNAKNNEQKYAFEQYFKISEQLKNEQNMNLQNCETIRRQEEIIERYEKILDKFTINYQKKGIKIYG